jgi:hypothetical protein
MRDGDCACECGTGCPEMHCNQRGRRVLSVCNIVGLRYITILYFLNDVEEGGETAFPVADNATFSIEVLTVT